MININYRQIIAICLTFGIIGGIIGYCIGCLFTSFTTQTVLQTPQITETVELQNEEEHSDVIYANSDEVEWIWKAQNGILDEFADVQWINSSASEGYFYFGDYLMPKMWWLNMSEEDRELRVKMLESEDVGNATMDFTNSMRDFYYAKYKIGQ